MITEFILIGGFWFWALIALFVVLEIACIENVKSIASFFCFLAFLAILALFSSITLGVMLSFVASNWPWVIVGLAGYLIIGTGWSTFKWKNLLYWRKISIKEGIEKAKKKVAAKKSDTERGIGRFVPRDEKTIYSDEINQSLSECDHFVGASISDYGDRDGIKPTVGTYKEEIFVWITWWPFSMVWYAIHDVVREVVDWIYQTIRAWYQRMSDKAFADIEGLPDENKKEDDYR
ncbi:hypothetical protein CMI47_10995 [Candidatus Pacearchaeota archaeon]|nr:hypothetical protein [Candidatus Pacearchaeota archaeon]|tara:strand:- start:2302 stop:3000 length:699 start_codon:yes stop_codon:yes gene_type:complete